MLPRLVRRRQPQQPQQTGAALSGDVSPEAAASGVASGADSADDVPMWPARGEGRIGSKVQTQ